MAVAALVAAASTVGRAAAQSAIDQMLQEEYRTQALYERAVRDVGPVGPLRAFAEAERGHAGLIGYLFADRGLAVPASRWSPDAVPAGRSPAQACAAALREEQRVIGLYDAYLGGGAVLPEDVRRAFRHNRNVAAHLHLPALRACAAAGR
jgi:hypothetical protein